MHQIFEHLTNFIQLVRQHILGVMGNVTHCFVGNSTNLPAVKELWKSVKIWRNYRHKRVACFLGHIVQFLIKHKLISNVKVKIPVPPYSVERPLYVIMYTIECFNFYHMRSCVEYNFGRVYLSVCQPTTFESLDIGSSYFHIQHISREYVYEGHRVKIKVRGAKK